MDGELPVCRDDILIAEGQGSFTACERHLKKLTVRYYSAAYPSCDFRYPRFSNHSRNASAIMSCFSKTCPSASVPCDRARPRSYQTFVNVSSRALGMRMVIFRRMSWLASWLAIRLADWLADRLP